MANLVDQINSIEKLTAEEEQSYQKKLQALNDEFDKAKKEIQAQSESDLAAFQQQVLAEMEASFATLEKESKADNDLQLKAIEEAISQQGDELAQNIAMKVVEQLWQ